MVVEVEYAAVTLPAMLAVLVRETLTIVAVGVVLFQGVGNAVFKSVPLL